MSYLFYIAIHYEKNILERSIVGEWAKLTQMLAGTTITISEVDAEAGNCTTFKALQAAYLTKMEFIQFS